MQMISSAKNWRPSDGRIPLRLKHGEHTNHTLYDAGCPNLKLACAFAFNLPRDNRASLGESVPPLLRTLHATARECYSSLCSVISGSSSVAER